MKHSYSVHIFPPYLGTKNNPGNLYSKLLFSSFEDNKDFCIKDRLVTGRPLWDLIFNLDADIYIFSWIEWYANSLFGKVKLIYLFLVISLLRIFHKEVIWILHNKHPHSKATKSSWLTMVLLSKFSTHVITHAFEGIDYFENQLNGKIGKCHYIPHPVYSDKIIKTSNIKWDYIIWGEISPRKGIVDFLEFVKREKEFSGCKILVCGRCKDLEYAKKIKELCNNNIQFMNDFIPDDKLEKYISESRIIFFPYHSSSVLSSGALIYSLNFCKPIIGPNVGSFKDFEGIVFCYNNFDEIPKLSLHIDKNKVFDFIEENTWNKFPQKLLNVIV